MSSKTMYKAPAKCWTEAMPIGNGQIGAMVCGGVKTEKIYLNHDTHWSGRPRQIIIEGAYEALNKAKALLQSENYAEAHKCITENCLGRKGQQYLPFGDMELDFYGINENISYYRRELDLEKAVVLVKFKSGDVNYKREYFISYPDDVLVVKLSADKPERINFDLKLASPLKNSLLASDNTLYLTGECPGVQTPEYTYEYSDKPQEKGILFRGGATVISKGDKSVSNGILTVKNADEAVIIFSIKTSFNGFDKHPYLEGREYINELDKTLKNAENIGYYLLLKHHIDDYSELFGRVKLDLGKSGRENMPTDERIIKFNEDKNDISLYVLLFDFGRYLAIASAREGSQIANLQGIWNDSTEPPWSSNFTLNINTEMNQWPLLMCGLNECFKPFTEFMKNVSVSGAFAAKTIYKAKGFVMHSKTDIWLQSTPTCGDAIYAFWNGASGWLCRSLFEYYEYTGDKQYLAEECYPVMKKAAEFYLDIICDRGDGYLGISPATSPENGFIIDGAENIAVAKWAAMSDSIVYDLFTNCVKAIDEAEISDEEFKNKLEDILGQMKPLAIGEDGRLLEWNEDFCEYEVNHRHISHLYALHPADMITCDKTPELAEACRKTLEKRGDGGTGWSLSWKVNFRARLNEGNHALKLIDMMLNPVDSEEISYEAKGGIYPNMFDAHPPFQIDGNFGVVSGMIEMLVRCDGGEVKLLPALPDKWRNGKLSGVRIKGNKTVDMEWENGKLVFVNVS